MLFNSYAFLIFLPLVLGLYYVLNHRWQNRLLLVASYVFYGWWDWRFCFLLLASTLIDFTVGRRIRAAKTEEERKRWLMLSLVTNLGILGTFKYFNFFVESTAQLLEGVGFHADVPTLEIILPVGISFYTFQTLSYTIDIYRRKLDPIDSVEDFALYVSFFPQLVAGPIERATRLLPQIRKKRQVNGEQFSQGLALILVGFFLKVGIADSVASMVNPAFAEPMQLDSTTMLRAVYLFAIQIYADFAGYSNIARGVAKLLGVDLMENFKQPYFSTNVTEFWRRWHISLSTWLRDYLYIPLGGNRHGKWKKYRNLMLTMLIGGLWHGAAWTFVVWGGLHGIYLAVHKLMVGDKKLPERHSLNGVRDAASIAVKVFFTFHLVLLTWVFFRASDFENAFEILSVIFTSWEGASLSVFAIPILYYGLVGLTDVPRYLSHSQTPFEYWSLPVRTIYYAALILLIFFLGSNYHADFIYFQF